MTDFTTALDLEIKHLEEIVESIPEVVKLRGLQRVRAIYLSHSSAHRMEASRVSQDLARALTSSASSPGRRMSPERLQAIEFVSVHLSGQSAPVKTVDLHHALEANGINIGGSDPVNGLSALLSTSGKFVAHGRSGWTLKPSNDGNQVSAPAMAGNGNPGSGEPGQD
jgi:hypothetical protein